MGIKHLLIVFSKRIPLIFLLLWIIFTFLYAQKEEVYMNEGIIKLPEPSYTGKVSVEDALNKRRSVRDFTEEGLTLKEVSQLLWACSGKTLEGVTGATRTYPSAGGLYPLEIYIMAGEIEGVEAGVYKYNWEDHSLNQVKTGDYRRELAQAALGQRFVREAPLIIIITAIFRRTERIYGERGRVRFVPMDAGHAAQNVYLEAVALGLGTVAVGAFIDDRVSLVLGLEKEIPLYLLPVGRPYR